MQTGSTQRTFHIKSCLGRGGFGEVYRATMVSSTGLKSDVAVKVLRQDVDLKSDAVKRLRDEGRLLATLAHPAILRVLDFAVLEGRIALVTEYVAGEDLNHCIIGDDPMPARALLEVLGAVAEALNTAWTSTTETGQQLRLVHRDIKPGNIRISRHGEPRLLDFGIAWSDSAEREAKTSHNSAVGSLLYMAPERFGRGRTASAADVYALGCVLYEGLSDEPLFAGSVAIEMVTRAASPEDHEAYVATRLKRLDEDIPEPILTMLGRMLAHDQEQRPTAAEVAMECERIADEMSGLSLKRWCRRRNWAPPPDFTSGWDNKAFVDRHTSQEFSTGGLAAGAPAATETWAEGFYADDIPDPGGTSEGGGTTSDTFVLSVEATEEEVSGGAGLQSSHVSVPADDTLQHRLDTASQGAQSLPIWAYASPIVLLLLLGGGVGAYLASSGDPTVEPTDTEAPDKVETATDDTPDIEPVEAPPSEGGDETEGGDVEAMAVDNAGDDGADPEGTDEAGADEGGSTDDGKANPPPLPPRRDPVKVVTPPPVETKTEPTEGTDEATDEATDDATDTPEPEAVKYGRVTSNGKAKVRLVGDSGPIDIGQVPIGRYTVEADFGTGWAPQGRVDVFEGQTKSVRCNVMTFGCEVD